MARPVMRPIAHAALHSPRYCVLPGAGPAAAPELSGARLRQRAQGGAGAREQAHARRAVRRGRQRPAEADSSDTSCVPVLSTTPAGGLCELRLARRLHSHLCPAQCARATCWTLASHSDTHRSWQQGAQKVQQPSQNMCRRNSSRHNMLSVSWPADLRAERAGTQGAPPGRDVVPQRAPQDHEQHQHACAPRDRVATTPLKV